MAVEGEEEEEGGESVAKVDTASLGIWWPFNDCVCVWDGLGPYGRWR